MRLGKWFSPLTGKYHAFLSPETSSQGSAKEFIPRGMISFDVAR